MNPEDLQTLSKPKLARRLEELNHIMEDVQSEMVMIRDEILHRLTEEKKDGEIIENYAFNKRVRVTFPGLKLDIARELGAVKEAVDTTKAKRLLDSGADVPGVKITEYLAVRKLDRDTE